MALNEADESLPQIAVKLFRVREEADAIVKQEHPALLGMTPHARESALYGLELVSTEALCFALQARGWRVELT